MLAGVQKLGATGLASTLAVEAMDAVCAARTAPVLQWSGSFVRGKSRSPAIPRRAWRERRALLWELPRHLFASLRRRFGHQPPASRPSTRIGQPPAAQDRHRPL